MTIEKIFTRPDGTKYQIRARAIVDWSKNTPEYIIEISVCLPRKRTWKGIYDFDSDYTYRGMEMPERFEFKRKKYLEHVTVDEINETLNELWLMMKPKEFLTR